MAIGVIGLGNMGTAIASVMAHNGHAVLGWEHNAQAVDAINTTHCNNAFLPGVDLGLHLSATTDLLQVITTCDPLFIALPSRFIRPVLAPIAAQLPPHTLLVNVSKGIDAQTGHTAFQLLSDVLPGHARIHLSGPSIANEFAHNKPTAVMIAGPEPQHLARISALLDNAHFRTQHSDDAVGVELGGILKNIYAMGLGMLAASGADNINFKGLFLTHALTEMQILGTAIGAKPASFLLISGIGDLIATALSEHSHNAHLGQLLAQGKSLDDIRSELGVLPEGYNTLQMALRLGTEHSLRLPLAEGLQAIIDHQLAPAQLITTLLAG